MFRGESMVASNGGASLVSREGEDIEDGGRPNEEIWTLVC